MRLLENYEVNQDINAMERTPEQFSTLLAQGGLKILQIHEPRGAVWNRGGCFGLMSA